MEAARSLDRIVRSGAYSNIVVHQTELEGTDRSAHQSLVYAALRWLLPIDARIQQTADRALDRIEPLVVSVLRIAATESVILGREPHGVVDSAVESIGELGVGRAKSLVNAVARAIATNPGKRPLATAAFAPWMVNMLGETLPDAGALLASLNEPAPVGVRLRKGTVDGVTGVEGIPDSGYVTGPVEVGDLERDGILDVIDPASTAVAHSLDLRPGMLVADLAAAPGGKTRAIADAVGPQGRVFASDVHRSRIRSAAKRSKTMPNIRWVRGDAHAPPFRKGTFDRVLLDAPCTGIGSLRRRPEIRYRIAPDAPSSYGATQRAMLERALDLVRPGGRLVYSVCTVFADETVDVVAGLGAVAPEGLPGRRYGDGVLLNPIDSGTDGMFIAAVDLPART
jgi:16S rRNA (cytosine967-C5)-methyltransferase